ncbi:MAG: twin-arginine translocation signal domain-containing protein [Chthoniobacter sp.]|nr:twin-arginine translocation signal domain-containing protein [Chthoniobacter sp.]
MNPANPPQVGRRQFLKGSTATVLAGALPAAHGAAPLSATERKATRIAEENEKPGARDWQLTRVRIQHVAGGAPNEGYRSPWIEGYASRQSVAAGETIDFMVSANPPARFKIDVFRTGYYGGRGARQMTTLGPFEGRTQADPPVGEKRLRECRWEPGASLKIPVDWLSGVYLGRLTTLPEKSDEPYWQSYIVFIVRDDRPADILFQCSDNTWQAYNRWPDLYSLYDADEGPGWVSGPNTDVSFDRPYGKYRQIYDNPQSIGSGEWLCWEFPFAYWLEQHGYDVSYCSQADMLTPERGRNCKAVLSVGHDEYWDERAYHAAAELRDAGVNLLFFSGNAVCWVTPFRASSDGRPNRIINRAAPYAGLDRHYKASGEHMSHFDSTGPDEGQLMGAVNVIPVNGGGDWICAQPEHWIFEGTGMKKGDAVPGLVGWEYHGDPAKIDGLEVVAEGTAWQGGTHPQHWTATIYPGPKKNFVFNAATIFWAQGLSSPPGHMLPWSHWNRPHGPDERVQRITHNLLRRGIS